MNPRVAYKLLSTIAELKDSSKGDLPGSVSEHVDALEGELQKQLHGKDSADQPKPGDAQDDGSSTDNGASFGGAKDKTLARLQKARQDQSGASTSN